MRKEIINKTNKIGKKVLKNSIVDEFKMFISRGNVLDLAVGVIIGGAFQNLVTSLTDNIISPILGCFTEADFSAYSLEIGNLTLKYGAFHKHLPLCDMSQQPYALSNSLESFLRLAMLSHQQSLLRVYHS